MCVCVCLSVPLSLASDSSETIEVIIIIKTWHSDCLRHENQLSIYLVLYNVKQWTGLSLTVLLDTAQDGKKWRETCAKTCPG